MLPQGKSLRDTLSSSRRSPIPRRRKAWYGDCRREKSAHLDRPKKIKASSGGATMPASRYSQNPADKCPDISWVDSRHIGWCRPDGYGTIRDVDARRGGPASTGTLCRVLLQDRFCLQRRRSV